MYGPLCFDKMCFAVHRRTVVGWVLNNQLSVYPGLSVLTAQSVKAFSFRLI